MIFVSISDKEKLRNGRGMGGWRNSELRILALNHAHALDRHEGSDLNTIPALGLI